MQSHSRGKYRKLQKLSAMPPMEVSDVLPIRSQFDLDPVKNPDDVIRKGTSDQIKRQYSRSSETSLEDSDVTLTVTMESEDERTSPDCTVSPAGLGKKDKVCLVCGDKALGYNFNAVSCESCKAFFRRNAHKTIRGRCEGKCDVNIESRSFCKKCRLAKCFTVGMRKDMILNDEQKQQRKQKIIINKLRKHGHLPPEDTYAASPQDLTDTFQDSLKSQTLHNLRAAFPNLPDKDLKLLMDLKSDGKNDDKKNTVKYTPWSDSQDLVTEIIATLPEIDQCIVNELLYAYEQSSFLGHTQTTIKNAPTNPTEFINIAETFVRRIIKVSKNVEFFKMVSKEDQIALLKGAVVEIIMLRSAVNYDIETESWSLSTMRCLTKGSSGDSSDDACKPTSTSSNIPCQSPSSSITPQSSSSDDLEQLRKVAEMSGVNVEHYRKMFHQSNMSVEDLKSMAARSRADTETMSNAMANRNVQQHMEGEVSNSKFNAPSIGNQLSNIHINKSDISQVSASTLMSPSEQKSQENLPTTTCTKDNNSQSPSGNDIEMLRQMARARGLDPDKLRAMFMQGMNPSSDSGNSGEQRISADLLKLSSETHNMFLTYTKFIKSLMRTIHGDLLVLKLMIMLSLFSSDRSGVKEQDKIVEIQECYAGILQKYIEKRFPDVKNMFAKVIMKLTDLRNINEVHTKMLLKMKLDNIEPLLLEIFDLQG